MKKILKWVGIGLGSLIVLALVIAGGLILSADARFNRTYAIEAETVSIPTDAASLAFGERMADMHCRSCHGPDLGGGPFFADDAIGFVDASNLTAGKGGVGALLTDADWVRAIRHGVKHDGTSVFIMPSNDFYYLNDTDLGSIIAYMKSVPVIDREIRPRTFLPFAKLLYSTGAFGNLLYAETIPHEAPRPAPVPVGITVEYGQYLVNAHGCRSCHGEQLNGGQSSEPGAPFAPNLTPGGELVGWSETDFFIAMREGKTPSGRQLSEYMPWQGFKHLTDDELEAVWLYLQSVPKLQTAEKSP